MTSSSCGWRPVTASQIEAGAPVTGSGEPTRSLLRCSRARPRPSDPGGRRVRNLGMGADPLCWPWTFVRRPMSARRLGEQVLGDRKSEHAVAEERRAPMCGSARCSTQTEVPSPRRLQVGEQPSSIRRAGPPSPSRRALAGPASPTQVIARMPRAMGSDGHPGRHRLTDGDDEIPSASCSRSSSPYVLLELHDQLVEVEESASRSSRSASCRRSSRRAPDSSPSAPAPSRRPDHDRDSRRFLSVGPVAQVGPVTTSSSRPVRARRRAP